MNQQDNNIKIDETKLNELMLRLGFKWQDMEDEEGLGSMWVHSGEQVSQGEAIEALRAYAC